jgi:GT2 family glycosyltransferase
MLKFSFVIPNYNRYDLVHQTLFDIYKTCSPVHEVVIVNDGCTQMESFTGVEWWSRGTMLPVHELRLEENVGFLRASNAGMKYATGDIICLLSNDVRVKTDIVLRIEHYLKGNPYSLVGGRLLNSDTGWNNFDGEIFPYIEGWLLAMTHMGWEEVDYFDEQFAPNDFEDIDLSTKVLASDGLLFALPEDATQHIGAQSIKYSPEREALTIQNKEKFRAKWMK